MFSAKTYLLIGVVIGALGMLLVFIPLSFWAAWPRQRERLLEKDNKELRVLLKESCTCEAEGDDDGV